MSLLRKFKIMHMRINGFYGGKARWWLNAKQYDEKYNQNYTEREKSGHTNTVFTFCRGKIWYQRR